MLSDVAPSILAAVGERVPASMVGESLWNLWSRGAVATPAPSVTAGARGWGLRSATYKLIVEPADVGPPRTELYDLTRDAGEGRNVAARHPRVTAALTRRLVKRLAALTGVLIEEGTPPGCPLCGSEQMAAFWDLMTNPPAPASHDELDAATRERLRALGYVDR
jgi:hypothetical protein